MQTNRKIFFIFFVLLTLGFLALTAMMVKPYLLSVIIGSILALISQPVFRFFNTRGLRRRWAAGVTTIAVLVAIIAPALTFAATAFNQAMEIGKQLESDKALGFLRATISRWIEFFRLDRFVSGTGGVEQELFNFIKRAVTAIPGNIPAIFGSVGEMLVQLTMALIACYFFLLDGKRFLLWLKTRLPLDSDVRHEFFQSFRNNALSAMLSTVIAAFVQAVIMFFTFLILGIPSEFLAASATFLFAWIPLLGSLPVSAVGFLYLYANDRVTGAFVMLGVAVVIGVSDNLVRAYVLKGRDETHPLVGLVAILGGISMFGLVGVIMGPILAGVLISLLEIWPRVGGRFGVLEHQESVIIP